MDAPGRPRCWAGPGHQGARSPQASAAEPAMATAAGLSVRLVDRRSVRLLPVAQVQGFRWPPDLVSSLGRPWSGYVWGAKGQEQSGWEEAM